MKKFILIILFYFFFINKSYSLIEVDITRGNLDPLPIAVSPLHVDIKSEEHKDIKIKGEKITNLKTDKEVFLTNSEKDILVLLFERKKIEKKIILEKILKLKGDIETKTIESHLTRIRKKLLSINCQIEIVSKENTIYLIV